MWNLKNVIFLRPCNQWKRQHKDMKFWNWGPTKIWHNIESVAFYFSKSLHPTALMSHTVAFQHDVPNICWQLGLGICYFAFCSSLFRSFALSLFRSLLFRSLLFALSLLVLLLKIAHISKQLLATRSHPSLKKSDREWIALVTLYKRATVSESLSSLFKKEWLWANCSQFLLKRVTSVIYSFKKSNVNDYSQKTTDSLEKNIFVVCFCQFLTVFPSSYAQELIAPVALRAQSFSQSMQKEITPQNPNKT